MKDLKKNTFRWIAAAMSGIVWGYLVPIALAQVDSDQVLHHLSDDDFQIRQEMTFQLLLDDSLSLNTVASWYDAAQTPEQKHRLLAVARHHALRHLRLSRARAHDTGAIGLTHDIILPSEHHELKTPAIHVMHTLAGFPGHLHLRPGDLIVAFDGNPLPEDLGRAGFNKLIQSRSAGQVVEMTLLRDRQRLAVWLRLAGLSELTSFYDPSSLELRQPFNGQWHQIRSAIISGRPLPGFMQIPNQSAGDIPGMD